MTQKVARILDEAEQLSIAEREELADRLVESLVRDIPPEIQRAHITEQQVELQPADPHVAVLTGPAWPSAADPSEAASPSSAGSTATSPAVG